MKRPGYFEELYQAVFRGVVVDAFRKELGLQTKAKRWLFLDRYARDRDAVCDFANIDAEFFDSCRPRIHEVIKYVEIHDEYAGIKRPLIGRPIANMFIRNGREDPIWQDTFTPDGRGPRIRWEHFK